MIFYAKGNEITVIGCPVTDERCRITIYPDAIIVEDKLINKKRSIILRTMMKNSL